MLNKTVTSSLPYIFGLRTLIEAIRSGKEIDKCLMRKGLHGDLYFELFGLIQENKIPFQFVPVERINRITRKNHQGVVAFLSGIEYQRLDHLIPQLFEAGQVPLVVVLDEVTDVRNLGAISRTAECGGVHALVIPQKGSATVTPDAIKTSAGALYSLPVCRVPSLRESLVYLRNSGLQLVGATERAEQPYTTCNFSLPTAIVLGSEEHGLNPVIRNILDSLVRIPVLGKIESLNVSVAAGVLIYEVLRQRGE
jgi:23S rRNA (guanosine2251-2'-O)-methyltransferase